MTFSWPDSAILVTGGTGSFGKQLIDLLLREHQPRKVIVFSRDELKQHEMQRAGYDHPSLRYFLGDVRDYSRLRRALREVDVVVHAAALKQVPACEYNPSEAVKTNIVGSQNLIDAALDTGVKHVLALSTDKAVNPVNLYGATKLCAEKLFVHSNVYAGSGPTRFSCVRYGNVVGSRGSVVPVFLNQRVSGCLTVTDRRMTRFWLTLEQAARFVIRCIETMQGGEVFVPKIPSMKVVDLAHALAPHCEIKYVGIRPGEKLHETLVAEDEARQGWECPDMFVLRPVSSYPLLSEQLGGRRLPDGFRYTSDTNTDWLSLDDLRAVVGEPEGEPRSC